MRIIAVVIIYSIESWLALRYAEARIYIESVRDIYEAFVIYSFYFLMLSFLGGPERLAARLRETGRERAACVPGCCCFRPWRNGKRFVHRCTVGVYQYVLLKVLCSLAGIVAEAAGDYEEGSFHPQHAFLWLSIIVNVSQCYALFVLALFYVNTSAWLKPLQPVYKFGIVKVIVFVLFWQSVALAGAGMIGAIHPFWDYPDEDTAAKGAQDFIITIELFIFAVLYHYYYSYTDFFSADPDVVTPLMQLQLGVENFDAGQAAAAAAEAEAGSIDSGNGKVAAAAAAAAEKLPVAPAAAADGAARAVAPAPANIGAALFDILPHDVRQPRRLCVLLQSACLAAGSASAHLLPPPSPYPPRRPPPIPPRQFSPARSSSQTQARSCAPALACCTSGRSGGTRARARVAAAAAAAAAAMAAAAAARTATSPARPPQSLPLAEPLSTCRRSSSRTAVAAEAAAATRRLMTWRSPPSSHTRALPACCTCCALSAPPLHPSPRQRSHVWPLPPPGIWHASALFSRSHSRSSPLPRSTICFVFFLEMDRA